MNRLPVLKRVPSCVALLRAALAGALAGAVLVSGCAVSPPRLESPRPLYVVAGKIAARPEGGAARAVSFEWRRLQTENGLLDSATFTRHGVTVARMTVSPDKVEVHTASGKILRGEDLPAEHLGIAVPLRALGFWLAGESDPAHSTRELTDPGGMIRRISQHGWEIEFAARDDGGNPTRIEARFPGGTASVNLKQAAAAKEEGGE